MVDDLPLSLLARRQDSLSWDVALRRVLTDPEALRIVYQPIVDLVTAAAVGYEALARFSGPPVAGPAEWFAAAAKLGMAAELEALAVRRALATRGSLPPNCFLTVNVSPHLLDSAPVRAAFDDHSPLGGVVVELTEHEAVLDQVGLIRRAGQLREQGAILGLDDAGAGYSGLRQMAAVRPGLVKLDRSLVDQVDRDPVKATLAELLGRFAGRLDAWILAEGIERLEELDSFIALGFPLGQGYLLGRPGPDFAGIDPELARHIRGLAATGNAATIAALVERVDAVDERPRRTNSMPVGEVAVVVDAAHRPSRVLIADPSGRMSSHPISMSTLTSAPVDETMLAAISRPSSCRFQPIVCTDELGRFAGIVRVERLALALATNGQLTTINQESR